MSVIIQGGVSAVNAEVDATSKGMVVQLPKTVAQTGFALMAGQIDAGAVTGAATNRQIGISTTNRLEASLVTPLMTDTFNYTAQDTGRWQVPTLTTFTQSFAAGYWTLNASSVTTASAVGIMRSYWSHPIPTEGAIVCRMFGLLTQAPQANCTVEMGMFYAAGTTAPTDGVFFRYDATGTLKGVTNFNGTEITSSTLTAPSAGIGHKFLIVLDGSHAEFWIDGVLQASIASGTGNGQPMMSTSVQVMFRMYHAGSAPAVANQLKISDVDVWATDGNINKPWVSSRAEQGKTAYQGVSGQTMGSTALIVNSANPTAAVPTNTTAALGTGLGGIFWETASLAVTPVDGIICSFANPAGTVNIAARKLVITGLSWSSIVQTVLAGGPFVYSHFLCYGHTALSLATAEAAGTKAPRRLALGVSAFAATAAVGSIGANISVPFNGEVIVNAGEFIACVVRQNGTVGTSGTIQHLIRFSGFWA